MPDWFQRGCREVTALSTLTLDGYTTARLIQTPAGSRLRPSRTRVE